MTFRLPFYLRRRLLGPELTVHRRGKKPGVPAHWVVRHCYIWGWGFVGKDYHGPFPSRFRALLYAARMYRDMVKGDYERLIHR
jgi:hypothetical protein